MNLGLEQRAEPLKVFNILEDAWNLLKGTKWKIWSTLLGMMILYTIVVLVVNKLFGINMSDAESIKNHVWITFGLTPILGSVFITPLYTGAIMIGVKKARNESFSFAPGYRYFKYWGPLAVIAFIMALVPAAAQTFLNFPIIKEKLGLALHPFIGTTIGLFISIVYYSFFTLSLPLVADRQFSSFQAIATSFQKIKPYWYIVVAAMIFGYILLGLSFVPLLVGTKFASKLLVFFGLAVSIVASIWLVPFFFLIPAAIYHKLVDENAPQSEKMKITS